MKDTNNKELNKEVEEEGTIDHVKCITDFIAVSYSIINQTKLWHIQTRNYAAHKAFNRVYDSITDLSDDFIESYVGTFSSRPDTPVLDNLISYTNNQDAITYYKEMITRLKSLHFELDDATHLQNILDEMNATLTQANYLLTLN